MLVMYLLLAASHHQGPLALAIIELGNAYNWLPRITLWCVLAEELEVLADIKTSIKSLYYY